MANPYVEKLFDYTNGELIGESVELLLPETYRKAHVEDRGNFFKKPHVRVMGHGLNLFARRKDGFEFPVVISLAHYQLDNENLAVAFVTDNTEIKRAHDELEAKVEERTLALSKALEREKELSELKSRFVMTASHEFRTPLSAILSSISLIETYHKEEHKENRSKHIERIKACVKDLIDILNNFLSLEKMDQGKIDVKQENFNLDELARDTIEEVNLIKKSGQHINYTCNGPKEIKQDKLLLKNILLNLLSNAIKYSSEEAMILFTIEVQTEIIVITIQDDGIGIPNDEQQNLYEKFYRATNASNIKGTGLGLHIIKKYIELLKGTVSFTSSENNGTTFTVTIPHQKISVN